MTEYSANKLNQYTATADPSETFDYDEDGNMIEDGAFEYTWNCENRLVKVEPKSPAAGELRLSFAYDYMGRMGRRVQKVIEKYESSVWTTNAVTKFVWDGWLPVAELDGMDSDALVRTYAWGLDLSGTFQGADGSAGATHWKHRRCAIVRIGTKGGSPGEGDAACGAQPRYWPDSPTQNSGEPFFFYGPPGPWAPIPTGSTLAAWFLNTAGAAITWWARPWPGSATAIAAFWSQNDPPPSKCGGVVRAPKTPRKWCWW